jgi:hypothetical protein
MSGPDRVQTGVRLESRMVKALKAERVATALFDTVTVEALSADFQTKQLGEGMLTYRLAEDGRLVAPCGVPVVYHGLLHLVGDDGAEFMAVFTHGKLEALEPIVEKAADAYRCLGRGVLWTRDEW